jgi:hypothetical protein
MEFWRKLKLRWDSNVTTVLDDYTARSSHELTVSKGQHVRVVQKQLPNAPDWCLIRLLNDHHHHHHHHHQQQQNQSTPSLHATSSTTITSGPTDVPLTSPSKYTEGLVPTAILKSTKSSSSNIQLPPPLSCPIITSKSDQDDVFNHIDESHQRQSLSSSHYNKRKSSFRRILRTPVRRFSLKDSPNKDVKNSNPHILIATSVSTISSDTGDGLSNNTTQQLSSTSTTPRKVKAFTFTNTEDLTPFPDNTNSNNKSINNDSIHGIYKMTESSTTPVNVRTIISPKNDLENDLIEIPSSIDIQSQQYTSSTDTNINPLSIVSSSFSYKLMCRSGDVKCKIEAILLLLLVTT